ncbi:MAG TPA: flagellar basal body P-ring formation chaperone FlgA [Xanthobacteraceae bacterium]|nr:flagellar basal body P-ring formation chaperone FlgA [Xanthobacteraceae bacterium]
MRMFLALAFAAALAAPALASTPADPAIPSLKDTASVEGEFVRLGDLIENIGANAKTPVFRAPELGQSGTIQVYRVIEAARANGVSVFDTRGISEVVITRAARTIPIAEIERAVAETAAKQIGIDNASNVSVYFDSSVRPLVVEPNAATALRIVQFNYDPRSQRFDASIDMPGSAVTRKKAARISGYLYESVEVPTLARAFSRGEIIRDGDIEMQRRPKAELTADTLRNTAAVIGHAARRDLRAGVPLRVSEMMKPELVGRGDTVTLTFESPGVMLSVRARAVESGTEGDVIPVTNPQSKRTVQATVDGPGHVIVRSMKAARSASIETADSVK